MHEFAFNGRTLALRISQRINSDYLAVSSQGDRLVTRSHGATVIVEVFRKARMRKGYVHIGNLNYDVKTMKCIAFRDLFSLKKGEFERLQTVVIQQDIVKNEFPVTTESRVD